MAANQPPPETTDPEEQKKLQLFLERAAPIVLDSRVLDAPNWQRLVALARELEMTDGQLRSTVEDLRRRGVIERVELQSAKPPPKPPPLPNRPVAVNSKPDAASAPPGETTPGNGPSNTRPSRPVPLNREHVGLEEGTENGPPLREKTFSLNSPAPPQPTPPPPPPATPRASVTPAAPPLPLPRSDRVRSGTAASAAQHPHEQRCEQLSARAAAIIAEQRGLTPKTHSLIAAAADELGLSDQDVSSVIRSLHQVDRPTKEPPAEDANQRQRWKEEGKPEPPRHAAPKKPHEIFTAFVAKSLDRLAVGHVSRDLEEGLVAHGTKVLKLSQVYASQLVRDVAQQKDLLLESVTTLKTQVDDRVPVDPRLQTFLDRAAPILAQNRGLNARSRVLLGAMAEEVGLPQGDVDAAVALLESRPAETGGLSAEQRERLEPFRQYAGELLAQLPQKILTARVHAMMLERGDERFGIEAEQARGVLRELAGAQQVQIITEEEALHHIEGLVEDHIGDALRLDSAVKQRILQEGAQWGLSADQVEQIIKQRSRQNYQKRRSEQNLSNAALVAAMVAVLLVIGFLGWAVMGGRLTPVEPTPEPPPAPVGHVAPPDDTDDRWWSVELVLAIHNATTEFPLLRRNLKAISSPDPDHRANAYTAVIHKALRETDDSVQRNMLLSVISHAYVVEPNEAAAGKIRQQLIDAIPGPEDRLSTRAADYPGIFWAMRGAVAAMHAAADAQRRADAMARAVGDVMGATIDRHQPLLQLERQCLGALAERLFRLMIASADTYAEDMLPLHDVIAAEAGRYLDRARLEILNADFLAAFLPRSAEAWKRLQPLIDATMKSRDPLVIAKLIDVYEDTTNDALRSHLRTGLLRRAGLTPKASEPREIASEIRQAMGITEVVTAAGRATDFRQLAQRELAWTSSHLDERIKAAEQAARLSRIATLGCALAQEGAGVAAFDELIKREPIVLTARPPDDDTLFPTDVGTDWDALERINSAVTRLPREGSANRVARMETIAGSAERVRDLEPGQATILAAYLLLPKSSSENERVLAQVPKIRHWARLQLAIADGIYRTSMDRDQLQAVLSRLLDETVTLGEGAEGREAVRGALLRNAKKQLAAERATGTNLELVDRARSLMFDQYVQQANLLDVPQPTFAEATGPAAVLKAIIEHAANRLSESGLDKETMLKLADVPHRLAAIEYIATNRLQQTALLQRVWLELVATDLKRKSPGTAADAERIIGDLRETDRTAANSLAQINAGEAALVRMWMLWNRSN